MKALGSLKCFKPVISLLLIKNAKDIIKDILPHEDLLHTNIIYQYLAGCLLNSIMHLFYQIQNLLLIVFPMDDLEHMVTLSDVLFCFNLYNHQNLSFIFT